jgi:GntR family transcriptional regulator
MTAIPLQLDPASPTPLYHQIAQAIRWRIGTGVLPVGGSLPSARRAAEEWGVNFHTVRQAYAELVRQGLVESQVGSGTRVVSAGTTPGELRGFLEAFCDQGAERFGLTRAELAALLTRPPRAAQPDSEVLLVECNTHQCGDLAQLLSERWRVTAIPWELARTETPPDLPIVSSYFHLNEVRELWPERISRMHFAALQVDQAMLAELATLVAAPKVREIVLCEQDATTGRQMAALRRRRRQELILVAPRVWDRQNPEVRSHAWVREVRYVFRPDHLEALGLALGVPRA